MLGPAPGQMGPGLFSAVARSATPLQHSLPADLTVDNLNNMLLSDLKCSLKTYFYKLSFATLSQTVSTPAIRFFKLKYGASPAACLFV